MKAARLLLLPRWARRLIVIPAFLVAIVWLVALMPLWAIAAAFASRFVPGRWRVLRIFWFLVVYVVLEFVVLVALFALWVASGFGRSMRSPASQARHYALMGWFLRRAVGSARRTFGLTFQVDGADHDGPVPAEVPDTPPVVEGRPVLVFSRHAGPGDSILLVDGVLNGAGRNPRIVLKDFLQLDPAIDVVLNRVPTRFVPSGGRAGEAVVEAIADLAGTAGPDDALVLFPEGGNFSAARRDAAIEKLSSIGRDDLAARAVELANLLPPKPTGALAAIAAAPGADVVFVGHHGLERLSSLADVWRGLPMDFAIRVRLWRVPFEEIPPPDEREIWLYDQWEVIDTWVDECLAADAEDGSAG